MDYLEAASLLGQTLLESEICIEFKASESALLSDTEAQKMLLDYRQLQEDMVKNARDDIGKEELEKVRETLLKKQAELNEYPVTKRYFDAKRAFEQMMQEVNSVLEHYLTGEKSDCTGECTSCSGCEE